VLQGGIINAVQKAQTGGGGDGGSAGGVGDIVDSVTGGVEGCASGKGGVGVEDIVNVDLGEEHLGEEDSIHQGKGADSGGGESGVLNKTGLQSDLVGTLYLVLKEMWEDFKGFEVWEIMGHQGPDILGKERMLTPCRARKWIHEDTLVSSGQGREVATDLPDKVGGGQGVKLGKKGERRFAPRVGRPGHMKWVEPVAYGDIWVQIPLVTQDVQMYTDTRNTSRPAFVFTQQEEMVARIYSILAKEREESGDDEDYDDEE
jgi:hypothetical protein